MFHPGDLNSGISSALQQSKLVLCFIREDENARSAEWEDGWLQEEADDGAPFGQKLGQKAVLLRIEHGSQEAAFLAAFCTIDQAPTIVVIDKGRVLEKLEAETCQDEWRQRLVTACGLAAEGGVDTPASDPPPAAAPSQAAAPPSPAPSPSQQPHHPQPPPQTESPQQTLNTLFPDRAHHHTATHSTHRAAEAAALQARQQARRQEAEEAHAHSASTDKGKRPAGSAADDDPAKRHARATWLHQQKQRRDEAKRDRDRILRQIEADKAERRVRAQNSSAARNNGGGGGGGGGASGDGDAGNGDAASYSPLPPSRLASHRRSAGPTGTCALQIRLFDGSALRARFPVTATLDADVRPWIRANANAAPPTSAGGSGTPAAGEVPYTFRHIDPPAPSRSIEVGEEHRSLGELGLAPTATVVVVPVAGYAEAYAGGAGAGAGLAGLVSGAWRALPSVSDFLPSFMGGTGAGEGEGTGRDGGVGRAGEETEAEMARRGQGGAVRVKTLADQRAEAARRERERGAEFYNGNSLGFEGRKGDEGDKGK